MAAWLLLAVVGVPAPALAAASTSTATAVEARAPAARGVVWVTRDAPAGFVARLRGQLSDLPWSVRTGSGPPVLSSGRVRARLERVPGGLELVVETPHGDHRRSLQGLGESLAAYEAAAVMVRGVVREVTGLPAVAAAPDESRPASAFFVRGGLRGETWGLGAGTVGADGTMGLIWGGWSLGVGVDGAFPQTHADADLSMDVLRWAAHADLERSVVWTDRLRLRFGLRGAVVGWQRRSEARSAGVRAEPERWIWGASATPVVGLAWGLDASWGLDLTLGLDAFFGQPRYVLDDGQEVAELWPVSPWLRLGVEWDPQWWGSSKGR
ncbi:MAG: hypothetical protein AAFZ18_05650 [Myxococcota bacterium]